MIEAALLATVALFSPVELPESPGPPPARECGEITVYGFGSKWHGERTATGEKLRPETNRTVAHRTLPFGTVVLVESAEDDGAAWARVNDRGPYMVEPVGGGPRSFHGTTLPDGYEWSNFLDVTPATARAAGLEGFERVCLRYWSTPRRPERWSSAEYVHSVRFGR